MPNPILGDEAGTVPNSGTCNINANITMPNSGLNDKNVPNSGTENTSNSGLQFVTLPLSSQLIWDAETNEIRSATDKSARFHEITQCGTMAAPIHESTFGHFGEILTKQQSLLDTLVSEVKQLKSQTPNIPKRAESEKIYDDRPEFDLSDEESVEEIRKTMALSQSQEQPDIYAELDDLLHADAVDSDEDDDLIKQIEQFYEQDEKCSGKVNDRLAKVVNDGICVRINEEKKKELLAKHFKPENCQSLQVPRVNKGIWTSLGRKARDNDLKLQNSQTLVCKAFYPLVHLMDLLMLKSMNKTETKTVDAKNALALANDTFKIMQMAFADLSQRRRDFLKPELTKEFKTLCAVDNPVTSKLFGDDLDKQIKEISDARRVSRKITQSGVADRNNRKYQPYDRNKSSYPKFGQRQFGHRNTKTAFLERRQQPKMFKNYNQTQKK